MVFKAVEQGQVDFLGSDDAGFFPSLVENVVVNQLLEDASVGEALDDFLLDNFLFVVGRPFNRW